MIRAIITSRRESSHYAGSRLSGSLPAATVLSSIVPTSASSQRTRDNPRHFRVSARADSESDPPTLSPSPVAAQWAVS
ncbi:hypothetical protein ACOMHN_008730 [Nucella lapillus]